MFCYVVLVIYVRENGVGMVFVVELLEEIVEMEVLLLVIVEVKVDVEVLL